MLSSDPTVKMILKRREKKISNLNFKSSLTVFLYIFVCLCTIIAFVDIKIKQIIRFLTSGGLAASVEFLIFMILLEAINNLFLVNSISFLSGLVVSYNLNRIWVFKSDANVKKQFVEYFILALINLVFSGLIVYGLVDLLSVANWTAKIFAMGIIAFNNYFIFSKFIFKK